MTIHTPNTARNALMETLNLDLDLSPAALLVLADQYAREAAHLARQDALKDACRALEQAKAATLAKRQLNITAEQWDHYGAVADALADAVRILTELK